MGKLADLKKIKRGVSQRSVFAPDLFSLNSEMIMGSLEGYPGDEVKGHGTI